MILHRFVPVINGPSGRAALGEGLDRLDAEIEGSNPA
jgi:hypothetical protein